MAIVKIDELLDGVPVEEAMEYLFPAMGAKRREEIVHYLHSGGVLDTEDMRTNWTTKRLQEELFVPEDICDVFSDKGILPPFSSSDLYAEGLPIFKQATESPTWALWDDFADIPVGKEPQVGAFWRTVRRSHWTEEEIFATVAQILDTITSTVPGVKYKYSVKRPEHKYPLGRYATFEFYVDNPEVHVWKLTVTEDEHEASFINALAGVARATKEMLSQQPGRGYAYGAVFCGWGNQLTLCKFVRQQFLPVASTLPLATTCTVTDTIVLGMKNLVKLMCAPTEKYGFPKRLVPSLFLCKPHSDQLPESCNATS